MMPDYPLEETIDFKFTSRQFSDGVPTSLSGGVVEIYEDNSATQITGAETLSADFDSVTGLNNLRIVATAANGFEAGKSYHAVLSAGSVGGTSVIGEVVAQFSIQRSPVNWANVTAPTTAVDLSATDIQLCDTITTYTGNTVQTGDTFARLGVPAGASVSADIADVPTVAEFNARTLVAASYFDPAADTVANVTTVATLTGHTVQTGDSFARLGAPAGASVSADIAAIEAQTDDIGVAGAGLTAIPWNSAWDAEVESEVNDALDTAIAELGVATPTATPTIRTGLMLLYMALRNKAVVQTSGTDALEIYNAAGTMIASKLLTDDGSDYTEAQMS